MDASTHVSAVGNLAGGHTTDYTDTLSNSSGQSQADDGTDHSAQRQGRQQEELYSWTVSSSVDTTSLLNTPRVLRFSERLANVAESSLVWRFPRASSSTPVPVGGIDRNFSQSAGKRIIQSNTDSQDIDDAASATPPPKRLRRRRTLRCLSAIHTHHDASDDAMDQDQCMDESGSSISQRDSESAGNSIRRSSVLTVNQNDFYPDFMDADQYPATPRQGSVCSDRTTGSSITGEDEVKPGRRRKLRPRSAIFPTHTNLGVHAIEDKTNSAMVIDDDDSTTFQPSGYKSHHQTIQPVVLGTHSGLDSTRRRIRQDRVTAKLDQLTSRPSHTNFDLAKHLYIPTTSASDSIGWTPPPLSPRQVIVIDDTCSPNTFDQVAISADDVELTHATDYTSAEHRHPADSGVSQ